MLVNVPTNKFEPEGEQTPPCANAVVDCVPIPGLFATKGRPVRYETSAVPVIEVPLIVHLAYTILPILVYVELTAVNVCADPPKPSTSGDHNPSS